MPRVCWTASPTNRYFSDVLLGGSPVSCMIDLGLVDAAGTTRFELEPGLFDGLVASGDLTPGKPMYRRDSSGNSHKIECGQLTAQLYDPHARVPVGPVVSLTAAKGAVRLPSRVGVAFFHALAGCRVDWDLTARRWCVECP